MQLRGLLHNTYVAFCYSFGLCQASMHGTVLLDSNNAYVCMKPLGCVITLYSLPKLLTIIRRKCAEHGQF